MFFRFSGAVALVVIVSLLGIALEKSNLTYRSALSRQHYQFEELLDQHALLRTQTQQMGAPARMIDAIEDGRLELRQPEQSAKSNTRPTLLLRWQRTVSSSP